LTKESTHLLHWINSISRVEYLRKLLRTLSLDSLLKHKWSPSLSAVRPQKEYFNEKNYSNTETMNSTKIDRFFQMQSNLRENKISDRWLFAFLVILPMRNMWALGGASRPWSALIEIWEQKEDVRGTRSRGWEGISIAGQRCEGVRLLSEPGRCVGGPTIVPAVKYAIAYPEYLSGGYFSGKPTVIGEGKGSWRLGKHLYMLKSDGRIRNPTTECSSREPGGAESVTPMLMIYFLS
jgi:hypothetical protein